MTKIINGFWPNLINGPRVVEILKSGHGVEEESVEKLDIMCNPSPESLT